MEGIPVRCRVLPGNRNDAKCVGQVQKDLNDWKPGNVIRVMDRGMTWRKSAPKWNVSIWENFCIKMAIYYSTPSQPEISAVY